MNTDFKKILERVARESNSTPEEVYREMQIAIDSGFDNPDPEVQKHWKSIHFKGARPTPEDVVFGIAMMLSPEDRIKQ